MSSVKSKQLLVEGQDDKFAVVGLMEHYIPWPDKRDDAPVFVDAVGSVTEILSATYLRTKLKESSLQILGIMLDADDAPASRWESFRAICRPMFPTFPAELPPGGLIIENAGGIRLGFWLMPDCSSSGMLESFLRHLVPVPAEPLWQHARTSFDAARSLGAACRVVHSDKARVHTWLAWQDPPGESLGRALTRKTLDPKAPAAAAFVSWFKRLYRL
ncbi:DUF3226 domain-containing protein [Rhodopila globiformis]|uniref:Uncharacterized protein n=1 Tax=Rhodopila globiformis TaxID=1071 RepID=A0A2S6MWL7_RHOGL|nr:DUF3226 domain-containing protein [Rhodopila globiformis]PPQ26751.1 hypothetical protein CCS01_28890 [Rhodopila globiformis]